MSPAINILGFNWKSGISSFARSVSLKLGVLYSLRKFFSPAQLLTMYKGLRPCAEYASHLWQFPHTLLLNRIVESFLPPWIIFLLNVYYHEKSSALLHSFLSSVHIFTVMAQLIILTVCFHYSCGLAPPDC